MVYSFCTDFLEENVSLVFCFMVRALGRKGNRRIDDGKDDNMRIKYVEVFLYIQHPIGNEYMEYFLFIF